MKVLKFIYRLIVIAALIVSILLSLNLFGIEFLSPYMFMKFEYIKTYPNIKFYEYVLPLKDGAVVIFRGKIGVLTGDTIKWTKIVYQNHKGYSDGQIAVAYVQGGKYLHIITASEQKDIMYPVEIKDVKVKGGKVCVLLSSGKENYLIGYDTKQNILFSAKLNEKVIDFDIAGDFAVAIVKSISTGDLAVSYIDKRGVYMSKVLPATFSNSKKLFVIQNYIVLWDGKTLSVYDLQLQKKKKSFSLSSIPQPAVGNPEVLVTSKDIFVYNRYTDRFLFKSLKPFDWAVATSDKIVVVKGNDVEIYSLNINRLKQLKVPSFGFVKAVLSQDKLYYIFNDRIECYKERW
ncbi:hypothetical protein Calkr_2615 [Caldicellulosiruptor acetigenus I77R1B]|uniref:Uncharacterized protein n=1 Tax=Caldicellulosiruptor acetigenus (strain ATCC 700853 / DSM 12137 / I77R1B) TaxID=632335 RepID=E4S933_CALA7|nr:hypothetical protein [Caldicellulosiruptor acetigenus]ADQ42038.1 hypothetical protein Calkr_2615 [Caldicellulosiruptor acetigenus I77R1B]WAM36229.1 hypothetical protein OTK01_002624 [Caldicellulosiruptor acetigenus]